MSMFEAKSIITSDKSIGKTTKNLTYRTECILNYL